MSLSETKRMAPGRGSVRKIELTNRLTFRL